MADILEDNNSSLYENLILIDTGSNLTNKKFLRDLDSVLKRSQDSGKCLILIFWINWVTFDFSINIKSVQ